MKIVAALFLASSLAGCASMSSGTIAQGLEKADTDASLAYVAVADAVNAYEALPSTTPAQAASAETIKVKAWSILSKERAAYAVGQSFDASGLAALFTQASALGH